MRGEFSTIERMYESSTARGLFFDGNDAYVVEVYDNGRDDSLGIKLFGDDEEITDVAYNQPSLNGNGINESLSMKSRRAELPETDDEIEAFARYALQDQPEESLEYEGSRELEGLNY